MGLLSPYTHLHGENRSLQSGFYTVHFVKSILRVINGGGRSRPSDKGAAGRGGGGGAFAIGGSLQRR